MVEKSSVINVVRKTKDITEFKSMEIMKEPAITDTAKDTSIVEITKELLRRYINLSLNRLMLSIE